MNIPSHVVRELMRKQGVVAVGSGTKIKQGVDTGVPAVCVSVLKKKPKSDLKRRDLVPQNVEINRVKYPTDVSESHEIRAPRPIQKREVSGDSEAGSRTDRLRPVPCGVSIGHYQITAGTLGCLMDFEGVRYMASNCHVLANSGDASVGDPIIQPGYYDGGRVPDDQVGTLDMWTPIRFGDIMQECPYLVQFVDYVNLFLMLTGRKSRLVIDTGEEPNRIDFALARAVDGVEILPELFSGSKINGIVRPYVGQEILKEGRTTGILDGTVLQTGVTARISYGSKGMAIFENQVMYTPCSQGGDSGSAIRDKKTGGLSGWLFAGSDVVTLGHDIADIQEAYAGIVPASR